jgi:hypothetical protein
VVRVKIREPALDGFDEEQHEQRAEHDGCRRPARPEVRSIGPHRLPIGLSGRSRGTAKR